MSQSRLLAMLGFVRQVVWLSLIPVAAGAAASESPPAAARLDDVVVASQPTATTIQLKTSGAARYQTEVLDSPVRLVVDLADTTFAWRHAALDIATPPLRQVRGSQFRKDTTRIVIEFTHRAGYLITEERDGLVIVVPTGARAKGPDSPARPAALGFAGPRVLAVESGPGKRTVPPDSEAARGPIVIAQGPAAPARPGAPAANGRLISLDFKDADVVNLLRILAAESGKNIVIADDVKGKMSITLRNVPWEQALEIILESRGLEKVEKGNVLRIVTRDQLIKEREAAAKMREAEVKVEESKMKAEVEMRTKAAEAVLKEQEVQQRKLAAEAQLEETRARGPIREETIRLAYADPEDIAKTLIGLLGIVEGTPLQVAPPPVVPPGTTLAPTIGSTPAAERITEKPPAPPSQAPSDVSAKGITIKAHKPTNSIFIRHYEKDLERIKKLIRETLDVQLAQIKIQGRVTEISRTSAFDVGVQWGGARAVQERRNILVGRGLVRQGATGRILEDPTTALGVPPSADRQPTTPLNPLLTLLQLLPINATNLLPTGSNVVNLPATQPAGGVSFGIIGSNFNLNLAITALERENKARTFHRPEIVTMDNTKATISVGQELPYLVGSTTTGFSVAFKEAAVKLEVTPTVIREPEATKVKMKLVVEDNSRGDDVPSGSGGFIPSIRKRTAVTEVVVREGETLVIGGVAQRGETENVEKVPLFGDIPILGWLFKRRNTAVDPDTELVVFITPTVLRDTPRGPGPTAPPAR